MGSCVHTSASIGTESEHSLSGSMPGTSRIRSFFGTVAILYIVGSLAHYLLNVALPLV